ncbi:hypothetical protein [Streptomyces iconiensis]|uniref:Signal transduction histidine kinase n=1 Tax=Streptomyces iconiensis TaxID=1384038 RepID=A0ABT6ZPX1_9ACTN|nr:hypothetical protein [Streptomyces iconiensis]MDJ1131104.1 hypothetical protein [Streptomyces iconiensis]
MAEPMMTERITTGMRGGLRVSGLVILGAVHFGLALPALLVNLSSYERPWIQLAAFSALTLILLADAFMEATGRQRPPYWAAAGTLAALVTSVVATSQLPAAYFLGTHHWSFLEVGWFGVLLLFGRGPGAALAFIGCHLALTLGQLTLAGLPTRADAAGMGVSAVAVCAFQVAAAIMAELLRNVAAAAGETLREQERMRTEAEISARIHADQRERYRELDDTALPLLAGLADGSLSAADEEVRRRCGMEAARLRRLFAERDFAPDPLVHELRACIGEAERYGVDVQLAVRGAPTGLAQPVRRALTEPVLAALLAADRGARVTVVRGGGAVRVGVVTDAPDTRIPWPTLRGLRVRTVRGEGRLWTEISCPVEGTGGGAAAGPGANRSASV